MPDLVNRDKYERKYARLLAKLLSAYGGHLLEALGDPPDIANIPPDFFDNEAKEMLRVLGPFGEQVYLDAALELMKQNPGMGVDWALVNQRAVDWSRQYTFDLVQGITDTNRNLLQQSISAFFEQGQTRQELEERLLRSFGPVRAEMIAVTETTRASVQGELAITEELRQQGIEMRPIWQTNNDDLVCPICGPKHNKEIKDGVYPPAHPRCRCWVNHEIKN